MREADFTSQEFGQITRIPGDKWSFPYFLPMPLPRELELTNDTVIALSEARCRARATEWPGSACARTRDVAWALTHSGSIVQFTH